MILCRIFYPFIQRTETRERYYSGEGGWWNRQLWYMLNDDELNRYSVDWDPKQVAEKGIDTSTKWGRFKASYWFNALRNPAYNYTLTKKPIDPEGNYDIIEKPIDLLFRNEEHVSPLYWAIWMYYRKDGTIGNSGEVLALEKSIIGESKVWFHPNNNKELLYLRWSWAKKKKFWKYRIYITFRIGAFSNKYDLFLKWKVFKV